MRRLVILILGALQENHLQANVLVSRQIPVSARSGKRLLVLKDLFGRVAHNLTVEALGHAIVHRQISDQAMKPGHG